MRSELFCVEAKIQFRLLTTGNLILQLFYLYVVLYHYSQVLPHVVEEEAPQEIITQMRADVESCIVSDDDNREIDRMDTDDESDTDYQSENDDNRNFVVHHDEMSSEDDFSFYRRFNSDIL